MLRFRLFRLPNAKKYNYIPVYYDERKEQLQKRNNQETTVNSYETRIKGSFRRKTSHSNNRDVLKTNLRLLLIIIVLSALAFYFLYY